MKKIAFAMAAQLCVMGAVAQQTFCTNVVSGSGCEALNPITTAVPFMMIGPDSRSGAMGDVGAALSPDANSQHWNASKLAFAEKEMEISFSYSPWLRQLVSDMSLSYLSFYKRLNKTATIGGSMRYFTLGDITFTDQNGNVIRDFRPNEFALDVSYALKLSDRWAGGITARYINSNLTGGTNVGGADSRPGQAFAVDISAFYQNSKMRMGDKDATLALGFVISNIGNKISYTNNTDQDFLPTNLRMGLAYTIDLDQYNKLTFAYDANKLLVPTPPVFDSESVQPGFTGDESFIIAGMNPDVSVAQGIIQSFFDAPGQVILDEQGNVIRNPDSTVEVEPGSVFREELREITHGFGLEYMYAEQFAVRTGFFYEHPTKGNRQFFTVGIGLKYSMLGIDLSYIIPTAPNNPLANTIRFTIRVLLDDTASAPAAAPTRSR